VRERRLRVIREEDRVHSVQRCEGNERESGGKKLELFRKINMWKKENLVFNFFSFILNQWRLEVMKFRSSDDSTSRRVEDKMKTIRSSGR